jgi:hypothetical protein
MLPSGRGPSSNFLVKILDVPSYDFSAEILDADTPLFLLDTHFIFQFLHCYYIN